MDRHEFTTLLAGIFASLAALELLGHAHAGGSYLEVKTSHLTLFQNATGKGWYRRQLQRWPPMLSSR